MFFKKFFTKSEEEEPIPVRTILIVDDNDVDRNLLKSVLIRQHYSVHTARDGIEGYLKAKQLIPDIILSDCSMPEMNGIELFNLIRQGEKTCRIPFVFLTAMGSPGELVSCYEMGAENYICKPFNPKTIASQIDEVLEDYLPLK